MLRFSILFHSLTSTSSFPTSENVHADTLQQALKEFEESYPGAEIISITRITERGVPDWSSERPLKHSVKDFLNS